MLKSLLSVVYRFLGIGDRAIAIPWQRLLCVMQRLLHLEKLESRELLAITYVGPSVVEGSGLSFPAEYVGIDSAVTKRAEVRLGDQQSNILDSDRALVWSRGEVHGRLRFPSQPGVYEIFLLDENTLAVLARDQVTIHRPGQSTDPQPGAAPAATSPASSTALPSQASTPSGPAPIMNSSGRIVTPGEVPLSGDMAQIAASLGLSQSQVVDLRRQHFPGQVTGDEGKPGDLENESFAERSALPAVGTPMGIGKSYMDNPRGVRVHSPTLFALYENGAVRIVDAVETINESETSLSSLFGQPTEGGKPVEGYRKDLLGLEPISGKVLVDVVGSVFNHETGTEILAGPGKRILVYSDETFEIRKPGDPPGVAVSIQQLGPTAEQLGIDRNTEIKGPNGEISRAPQSAAQALANAKTPEEMDRVIQQSGQISTSKLEYIGTEYVDQKTGQRRVARVGHAFYQHPTTKDIVERPIALKSLAKQTTSPSVLAARNEAERVPAAPAQKPSTVPAVSKQPATPAPAKSNEQQITSPKSPSAAEQRRTLRNRLNDLEDLKRDTHRMYQKIFQELDDAVEEADKIRDGADNAASLGLLTMTAKNVVAVLRSVPKSVGEFGVELGVKVGIGEVAQYGLSRFNLLNPSFWSDMVELAFRDGQTTKGLLAETRGKVEYDYASTMTVIDKKIAEVQQALAAVK